jgi:hypothetical protein
VYIIPRSSCYNFGMIRKNVHIFARISLFIIYFWFGILKLLDKSPANPMVKELQQKTLPFLTFHQFIIAFAIFEMLIGLLFLFPKLKTITSGLFIVHMVCVFSPLVLLPGVVWQGSYLVPTLEGQYIIKNLALISLVMFLQFSKR